jgi:hypothetical protein
MRVIIGCLAAIGLVAVLVVAGCVGLIGLGIASAAKAVPPYATREGIGRRHASDLAHIDEAVARRSFTGLADRLSTEAMAVYVGDEEVLARHRITGRSHTMINGGGVGTLTADGTTHACVVVAREGAAPGGGVLVFFRDRQQPSGEIPVERP